MAWLQKRTNVGDVVSNMLYSSGLNKTVLIVGLGNPGKKYDLTRHNVGFLCLDELVKKNDDLGDWINKKDLKCEQSTGQIGDCRVIVIKPTTFMNLSGEAVQAVMNFYKLSPKQLLVLHDEIDVKFGQIRIRVGGSSAGHNGIKSVSQHNGEDYGRVRIGIGPKSPAQIKSEDFVLAKFTDKEQSQLNNLIKEVNAIVSEFIYGNELQAETRSFIV